MPCPAAVVLLFAGNSTALGALLFGSAYLTVDDLSVAASNLSGTIASASLLPQVQQQAYQEALTQALQLPSSDALATLAAAAVANNQTATIADAFAQVSLFPHSSPASQSTMLSDRNDAPCSCLAAILRPSCMAPMLLEVCCMTCNDVTWFG